MGNVIVLDRNEKITDYINTTSSSNNWSKYLSPFYLKNIQLYNGMVSKNMENAWQYSKVYPEFVKDGKILSEYYKWSEKGFNNNWANRYPMGKGKVPLFSLWKGERLGYVEAREKIYIPLYAKAVVKTKAFEYLTNKFNSQKTIYLWDFDGYNHKKLGMSYQDVINCEKRKMGHAFILAMLLEDYLTIKPYICDT